MNTNPVIELFEDALDKEKYVLKLYSSIIEKIRDN